MGWLEGTTALVTGAGSGLGHAIVNRYVAEGARVGVLEIDRSKADALTNRFGDAVRVTVGDARRYDDNLLAVEDTVAAFGGLDVWVGNAGLWDYGTSVDALPAAAISDAFDEIFSLNVKGYLLGVKAALPALRDSRGAVILTASNAAFWPGGGGPLYTASKHAVVGLVKQLAYELAPDVRVNGVAPGGMPSDLRGPRALGLADTSWSSLPVDDLMKEFSPLGRAIAPADYTGHYVLLAARHESATVTGSIHNCDGGIGVRGRPTTA
ncbi:3-(cis-5,6-dihydroxycyclohexa-1,3-dien-1-yl)propanoate dehydrogenase [Microtetraspora sp. AC03309]|uniref:3-(cis-5,6-dihydroxycyclohexa-1, 3-dien-1-yl)propanoate dehydrogenase n=1 Tax=Microtetraspora sp. AC03309 TaxID=2779376 RepID=UPI001E35FB01|nr:3-(cis-5,6-dihydroxycyclohexa-1,3-dien-1-yl)propanoate dehydrogenase [Microtetraspora sp. AC03309]MCC5575370.1 3-(cis-5,6-dihydroxycyclohexa-1,3-dien-1-yl)propanoate dehydrogenase [Microtetraspora sp. AC03309]